jgi:hypothetical protein
VQVGTSSRSAVSSGTDYAFISSLLESPRIASAMDLPSNGRDRSLTPKGSVVTGPYLPYVREAEGFPRHYPPPIASSLYETDGEGFAVMSGIELTESPPRWATIHPTRNFALGLPMSPWG